MVKTIAIAALAGALGLSLGSIASANDPSSKNPSGGQSNSDLNSLSPRSGSPSESGKTGIGSTSGSDASIDTGLKSTSQDSKMAPCPEKSSAQNAERNKGTGIVEGTMGDQQRKGDKARAKADASKRSNAEMSSRMGADPCMEGPASGQEKERR